VLGPQLAVKLRAAGCESAKMGGKIIYRLALSGILSGLVLILLKWVVTSIGVRIQYNVRQFFLITVIVIYLLGFTLLMWVTNKSKLLSSDNSDTLQLAALFLPLLFVPIMIFLAIQMGSYTKSLLLPAAEIVWVIAATIIIKD
jgi:hypothetical protein